ncbi:MAG: hypothetical protein OXC37_06590 [Bdellovibrionaceae bacterium]|nr:hypothetical protein [Pseudobdellovibrionaceae bacterium]
MPRENLFFQILIYIFIFLFAIGFSFLSLASENEKCYQTFSKMKSRKYEEEYNLHNWIDYKQAQEFVKQLNIKTRNEFLKFVLLEDKQIELPLTPHKVYEEWTSWEDFLGVEDAGVKKKSILKRIKKQSYLEIEDLEVESESNYGKEKSVSKNQKTTYIRKKRKKSSTQRSSVKRKIMRSGNWMSYEEAKEYIRAEGIRSYTEFSNWSKLGMRPMRFPSHPQVTYKEDWISWPEFLGTIKNWMSYEEAKTFIQKQGIKSEIAYRKWKREGKRPANFPSNPDRFYKEFWQGWRIFFGTN